jgi:hypothetical protein
MVDQEGIVKRSILVIIAVLLLISIAGCGLSSSADEPTATPEPTVMPEPTPSPTPEPTPTLEPSPTPIPEPESYTTGLPYSGEYKPVMVVIENSTSARPQTGLQTADVVYEVPVEGAVTRFVCVFSDTIPESVMPVRSGRVSFLYLQQEWNAVFMHFGGSGNGKSSAPSYTYFGNELHDKVKFDVDGLYNSEYRSFYKRVSGKSAPHNVEMYPQMAQQLYDYSPDPLNWIFDANATYTGSDATEIKLSMCSGDDDFVSYTYDAAQDAYLRSMNGKEFKSAETGAQVTVKNVIVQYSTYKSKDVYKVWEMTGGGNADIYIGGKLIKGSWKKDAADSPTVFYDDQGQQIVLRPGNTWIHIHPEV